MNKIFILILFSTFSFGQNKILSIKEIDSICLKKGKYAISEGTTKVQQNNKNIGSGGFSISFYINHYNEENYNNLSREEKRHYDIEKNSELIKGEFSSGNVYNNGDIEKYKGHFYYYDSKLFFVKVNVLKKEKGIEQLEEFNLTENDIKEGKPFKNSLLFDVQSWVKEKNIEILQFYYKK